MGSAIWSQEFYETIMPPRRAPAPAPAPEVKPTAESEGPAPTLWDQILEEESGEDSRGQDATSPPQKPTP